MRFKFPRKNCQNKGVIYNANLNPGTWVVLKLFRFVFFNLLLNIPNEKGI